MADQTLTVKVVGDEKDLLRSLRSSQQGVQRFSASFGTFVKGALVFEGVRAGVQTLTSAVRAGIDEFTAASKVTAQTNAIIAATGGVANVSAKDVDRLASRIQNLSGIDDEAIKSGAALLLTFRNVRNEVGKGNAVFDRATAAIVDLSAAGFGPIPTLAKQVGKALQDPVKGLTSLTRAGVTFTQNQRDQVKALVDSGRFMQAQKVILKEIEQQVGGTAKAVGDTLPGQLAKLRESFRNAFGNLVGAVAGPLGQALGAVASFIPKIEQGVGRISAAVGPALERMVGAFVDRLPEIQRIAGSILDPLRERVLPILQEFGAVALRVWANVVDVFDSNRENLRQILDNLGVVLTNVWTLARPTIVFLFEKALPAALNVAIPVLEKLTGITAALSGVYVKVVSTIVRSLDLFLGALSRVADAASHLPIVGDQFKGVADKVNASRESLRGFVDQLDAIDGRTASVSIAVDVTTGRREEGALGRSSDGVKKATEEAAEKQRAAFDALMARIGLRRDRAAATAGLRDDIRAAVDARDALREQLKIQKGNVDLERQLLQANQALAALRSQQRKGRQFEALGLTAEGQQRVPGVGALRNRLGNIREQIKGTVLDTAKTRSQLRQIAKVLRGDFGKVGKDVRAAILAMFNDISGALGAGGGQKGPLTKTSGLNTRKLVEGLGLTADQSRALRSRTSGFNTAGRGLATVPASALAGGFTGGTGFVVENYVTVQVGNQKVAAVVTKEQQKTKKRNPQQKRGPNRNR